MYVTEWDGGKKHFIQKWSLFKAIQLLLVTSRSRFGYDLF